MVHEIKYRQHFLFITLLLCEVFLFVSRAGLSMCTGLFFALAFLHKDILPQLQRFFHTPILIGMSFLFFIPFISGLWSTDLSEWASVVRVKLPLLLLPVAFAGHWQLSQKQWKILALVFIAIIFLGTAWSLLQYVKNPAAINASYLKAKTIATPLEDDHIRFSWLVSTAIFTTLLLYKERPLWIKMVGVLLMAWFAVYLHLLAARTGLFSFYLLLFAVVLRQLVIKKAWLSGLLILVCGTSLVLLAWILLPSFQNRVHYMVYDFSLVRQGTYLTGANDGNRWLSLRAGYHILIHHPFGVGAGNVRQFMNSWYDHHTPKIQMADRLFPGSEWLYYGCMAGWTGVAGFLLIICWPFFIKIKHRFFWMVLNLTAVLSLIFEVGLEVQFGVFIYAFTLLWWWKWFSCNTTK